jgi:hypothetical protein
MIFFQFTGQPVLPQSEMDFHAIRDGFQKQTKTQILAELK